MIRQPANPKMQGSSGQGRAHWYPYYAGYSPAFVADILSELRLQDDSVVLDPWNGSGTTTTVCSIAGVRSAGFDINPAMVVVAKARLLAENTGPSLPPLLDCVLSRAKDIQRSKANDPLNAWFAVSTASRLRAFERSICSLLVEHDSDKSSERLDVNSLSSLAAFFYVLLFRLVRRSLKGMSTSNPTWIRSDNTSNNKVRLTWNEIFGSVRADLAQIRLLDSSHSEGARYATADVQVADSRSLPLDNGAVDAVITSPPYCTRIDYAVATRAELAVLNIVESTSFEALRRNMLGTTLSNPMTSNEKLRSVAANEVLKKIRHHPSKASSGYYFSTFSDYFHKLETSLGQLVRVIKLGGAATIVVQDSSYKNIHVDLSRIVRECCESYGMTAADKWDFPVTRTMRQIHTTSRSHMQNWQPTESVLLLRKESNIDDRAITSTVLSHTAT
jgi:hypothetical protein